MRVLDWTVMLATLAGFVAYGVWRSRGTHDLAGYWVAGRQMPWPMVALSVMATQASAVTFLATPGQGYVGGLSFVQFYFGLPIAMVVLCMTLVPLYQRLRITTAYEFLEKRFDGKTRSLTAALFLLQRGLAAGITLYAPALVLSVILGWDLRLTCVFMGLLSIVYTVMGGSRAVGHTQALQFSIIMGTMAVAFVWVVRTLPTGVGLGDALWVAGNAGKLNAVDLHFDPKSRFNLWAGLLGGFFLQLSYFGTDQSQVGRILTARSTGESRMALLFNGLFKVPMQFFILLLGVLVFSYHQFVPAPVFFNPIEVARARNGAHAAQWRAGEAAHLAAAAAQTEALRARLAARHAGDAAAEQAAAARQSDATAARAAARAQAVEALKATDPSANTNDTNYVFLSFVLTALPAGIVGLVLAAIFAASMNSTSSELNALASTTINDVVRRIPGAPTGEAALLHWSRAATLFWALFAVLFAETAGGMGSLVEAVNILGSLFYGTILGIFLTGFMLARVGGSAVFLAAIVAEVAVVVCWKQDRVGWLWFNLIGCVLTMGLAGLFAAMVPRWRNRAT
ncbi:MAG: sodium:solute symporter [Candidatus Eisenbacteria bacterium]